MGAAFVIDILVIFFWKALRRGFLWLESLKWSRVSADLTTVCVSAVTSPGCPVVKISYRITISNESMDGSSEVPFLFTWSAKSYAETLPSTGSAIVRVDPKNPTRTVWYRRDQAAVPIRSKNTL